MSRCLPLAIALAAILGPLGQFVVGQGNLISETTAARHGLTRPWFAQLGLCQERARVSDIILSNGVLFVQSDTSMVQAVDAETGKTLWARQIGRSTHPSLAAAANDNLLAVVNGARLYVVNRHNGNMLYDTPLDTAPGAGITLSSLWAYVPMTGGKLAAYRLEQNMDSTETAVATKKDESPAVAVAKQKDVSSPGAPANDPAAKEASGSQPTVWLAQTRGTPLTCQSAGRVLVKPLVTHENSAEEYVAWCTDVGYLNIGVVNGKAATVLALKYRLEAESPIVCAAAFLPPDPAVVGDSGVIFVASSNGFVHAIMEKTGSTLWRFPTGESIVRSPVVIHDRLFVTTQIGGMFCLNAKTGESLWWTPDIVQFVAAGRSRVYGVNSLNNLVALDPNSGAQVDTIPIQNVPYKFSNSDNDRIYLADEHGLIQCLHEAELSEPLDYRPEATASEETPADEPQPAVREHSSSRPAAATTHAPATRREPKKESSKTQSGAGAHRKGAAPAE